MQSPPREQRPPAGIRNQWEARCQAWTPTPSSPSYSSRHQCLKLRLPVIPRKLRPQASWTRRQGPRRRQRQETSQWPSHRRRCPESCFQWGEEARLRGVAHSPISQPPPKDPAPPPNMPLSSSRPLPHRSGPDPRDWDSGVRMLPPMSLVAPLTPPTPPPTPPMV